MRPRRCVRPTLHVRRLEFQYSGSGASWRTLPHTLVPGRRLTPLPTPHTLSSRSTPATSPSGPTRPRASPDTSTVAPTNGYVPSLACTQRASPSHAKPSAPYPPRDARFEDAAILTNPANDSVCPRHPPRPSMNPVADRHPHERHRFERAACSRQTRPRDRGTKTRARPHPLRHSPGPPCGDEAHQTAAVPTAPQNVPVSPTGSARRRHRPRCRDACRTAGCRSRCSCRRLPTPGHRRGGRRRRPPPTPAPRAAVTSLSATKTHHQSAVTGTLAHSCGISGESSARRLFVPPNPSPICGAYGSATHSLAIDDERVVVDALRQRNRDRPHAWRGLPQLVARLPVGEAARQLHA